MRRSARETKKINYNRLNDRGFESLSESELSNCSQSSRGSDSSGEEEIGEMDASHGAPTRNPWFTRPAP